MTTTYQLTVNATIPSEVNHLINLGCIVNWDHSKVSQSQKFYILYVLLGRSETWNFTDALCKRMEAFETSCYCRMLRMSWTQYLTNNNAKWNIWAILCKTIIISCGSVLFRPNYYDLREGYKYHGYITLDNRPD